MYYNDQTQHHQQNSDDQLQALYHKYGSPGAVGFDQSDGTLNQCGKGNT